MCYGPGWKAARDNALSRDANKCVKCGSSDAIRVHHIKHRCRGGSNDPSNLTTLCYKCHAIEHASKNGARVSFDVQDEVARRLRNHLIDAYGSTHAMGAFLEDVISKALDDREKQIGESKGNEEALCSA